MRALLVEDSEQLCRCVGGVLQTSGYLVEVTYDGREGLLLSASNGYDIIVLDIRLPGVDALSRQFENCDGRKVHTRALLDGQGYCRRPRKWFEAGGQTMI